MYIRRKKYPSGNVGIIVVEKINGKMNELTTIGIARSDEDVDTLVQRGKEWIGREQERRPSRLDLFGEERIRREQEFYNPGIGAISIKESWNHLCNNYYITAGMVLGNLMARSNVRWQKGVPDDVAALVREEILKEGRETCSLEDDEVAAIYRRVNSIMRQIFHNPQVAPAVADIATEISRRRHVSGRELSEIVRQLL